MHNKYLILNIKITTAYSRNLEIERPLVGQGTLRVLFVWCLSRHFSSKGTLASSSFLCAMCICLLSVSVAFAYQVARVGKVLFRPMMLRTWSLVSLNICRSCVFFWKCSLSVLLSLTFVLARLSAVASGPAPILDYSRCPLPRLGVVLTSHMWLLEQGRSLPLFESTLSVLTVVLTFLCFINNVSNVVFSTNVSSWLIIVTTLYVFIFCSVVVVVDVVVALFVRVCCGFVFVFLLLWGFVSFVVVFLFLVLLCALRLST